MDEPSFKSVLQEYCDSPALLVRALGINRFTAYRYWHGRAVPKLSTLFVQQFADYFRLSKEELQRLERAQISSLKQLEHAQPKSHRQGKTVSSLVWKANFGAVPTINSSSQEHPRTIVRGFQPRVITDRLQALEETTRILESLPDPKKGQSNEIVCSYFGESSFTGLPELHDRRLAALYAAMKYKKWTVREVFRLENDSARSVQLVEDVLPHLTTGRYFPMYLPDYQLIRPPYGLVIIPAHYVILFLATNNPYYSDSAAILRYGGELASLYEAHFRQILAQSKPVLKTYLYDQREAFWLAETEAIIAYGNRATVKAGTSDLSIPSSWYQPGTPWMQRVAERGLDVDNAIWEHTECLKSLEKRIVRENQHICTQKSVLRIVEDGQYDSDYGPPSTFRATEEMRREHLTNLIEMLERYENYFLACIDSEEEKKIPTEAYWSVVGEERVFLQTWHQTLEGELTPVLLELAEPTLVKAFRGHFANLWESIAPKNKDKRSVIEWLRSQLAKIPEDIN